MEKTLALRGIKPSIYRLNTGKPAPAQLFF